MTLTNQDTYEIRKRLGEFLGGEVTARHLFMGYGLFYQDLMFGIYSKGQFYLKGEHKLAEVFENMGAVSWTTTAKSSDLAIANYYELPISVTKDENVYKRLVIASVKQIQQKKLDAELARKERIKELPNLSIKHERLLAKIDIYDVKTFKEVGPFKCFIQLKQKGIPINIELFWLLLAALQNKHVSLLTHAERKQALLILNKMLVEAGYKEIKSEYLL
ncbi:TfoX/Sxy family DNA transformation protein [Mannheimia massilioguelmaensis]|nr:TfoX/Sxy family DNA transformation protein [Mannheimia massilioguelmaensis]